ncbi:hypothetical protein EVAR_27_1 [Eumeta japonica]|uniref:Histone acetyltransferase n=1 Tax=Eumeta variegata TaxID=151549 RepID=A0A4C1S7M7_EUMVA|nr:hypothetical protein EVAR_27_1 [Eumeta japonica]
MSAWMLCTVTSPSMATIKNGFNGFQRGRTSVFDDPRRLKVYEIAETVGISKRPQTKEQLKQWTSPGEYAPKKAKTVLLAGKMMATIFWDSKGGRAEKHFTWDACPMYHNVTAAWCLAAAEERAAATVARRRALHAMAQRPRAQPTIEQRAYQLKVKDMRSKWKGSGEFREKNSPAIEEISEEREPQLEGFTPDYDLRLFREAQALAAIKIEEELGDLPSDRGTKYVIMGKYMMEVWYQSPYPGDAARAPRLYICEFCLTHHKSQTGATRHAAKCVWRHPPGDEVYRKGDLSVWQVDGRKHKQYCQQLCLLAKFFLDHKTLYYDVEPFLFYVMTIADQEGCHILGYFSKRAWWPAVAYYALRLPPFSGGASAGRSMTSRLRPAADTLAHPGSALTGCEAAPYDCGAHEWESRSALKEGSVSGTEAKLELESRRNRAGIVSIRRSLVIKDKGSPAGGTTVESW